MSKMKINQVDRPRLKLECLRLLVGLRLNRAKQQLISGFVDQYLHLTQSEELQFEQFADNVLPRIEKERVMELTTSWKEAGRVEGQKEGIMAAIESAKKSGTKVSFDIADPFVVDLNKPEFSLVLL